MFDRFHLAPGSLFYLLCVHVLVQVYHTKLTLIPTADKDICSHSDECENMNIWYIYGVHD
jgi:hypothetical protein